MNYISSEVEVACKSASSGWTISHLPVCEVMTFIENFLTSAIVASRVDALKNLQFRFNSTWNIAMEAERRTLYYVLTLQLKNQTEVKWLN